MDALAEPHVAAFIVWAAEGEQDTGKTAEITGIPRRTIQFWMKRDDWRGQWLAHGAPEAERAAQQGRQMMRHAMPVVAKRLLSIIGAQTQLRGPFGDLLTDADGAPLIGWASSDRDAVQAAKLLALYGLGSPLSQTDVSDGGVLNASYTVPSEALSAEPPEPGTESVAQLRAAASAAIESTVSAVNTRVSTRGRRV